MGSSFQRFSMGRILFQARVSEEICEIFSSSRVGSSLIFFTSRPQPNIFYVTTAILLLFFFFWVMLL